MYLLISIQLEPHAERHRPIICCMRPKKILGNSLVTVPYRPKSRLHQWLCVISDKYQADIRMEKELLLQYVFEGRDNRRNKSKEFDMQKNFVAVVYAVRLDPMSASPQKQVQLSTCLKLLILCDQSTLRNSERST